jgi:hypothetical protein
VFRREEFLIEMLIELNIVDGQHRAGFFLYTASQHGARPRCWKLS